MAVTRQRRAYQGWACVVGDRDGTIDAVVIAGTAERACELARLMCAGAVHKLDPAVCQLVNIVDASKPVTGRAKQ